MITLADMRDTGADQRARGILAAGHPKAAGAGGGRVDEGTGALFRPEQLVRNRLVDDARDDLFLALERNRNRKMRHAVQEVRGAVERIDDPAVAAVTLRLAAFLTEEAVVRPHARQLGAQGALGLDVGMAHEIARTLFRDLQMLDLAEVALQALGRRKGGTDHHRDGGRARRQRLAFGRTRTLAAFAQGGAADAGDGFFAGRTIEGKGHVVLNPWRVRCSCRLRC